MKRLFVIPLVGVMLAILAVPVLAEENSGTLTITTEPKAIDVLGKRDSNAIGAATIYSVDIKWGNMKAIYTPERTQKWDPDTLKYIPASDLTRRWTWDDTVSSNGLKPNQIALTNHSNAEITCTFEFSPEDNFSDIRGEITNQQDDTKNILTIQSAENVTGTTIEEKLSQVTRSGFLQLSGQLDISQTNFQKIGTILVTLN